MYQPQSLAKLCPRLDNTGLDLLVRMLQYDPDKRISADAAMKHAWFDDLKLQKS